MSTTLEKKGRRYYKYYATVSFIKQSLEKIKVNKIQNYLYNKFTSQNMISGIDITNLHNKYDIRYLYNKFTSQI